METLAHLKAELIAAITAIVSFIIWLVKLESDTKKNAESIRALYKLRNEDIADAVRQRTEDREAATESRKNTHDMLVEMQRDIKQILSRGS
jgi:hypothetical protein